MRRSLILIPVSVFTLAFVATQSQSSQVSEIKRIEPEGPAYESWTPGLEEHGITEIGLERTRCYGTCPAYKVTIYSDGRFEYEGRAFVEREGLHTGQVSKFGFNILARFIRHSGFSNWKSSYTRMVTDLPTVFTTVVIEGEKKRIKNYANAGPPELWAIEQLIDKLLLEAEWDEK